MRRTMWLAGAGLVLALGPGAAVASADPVEVRVGAGQLRISELEPPMAPNNYGTANDVTVTLNGSTYTVASPNGATASGTRCVQRPLDANTVDCTASPGEPIDGITVQLKGGDDRLDLAQNITVPATVSGGPGNDRIYGGGGNDTLNGEAGQDAVFGRGGNDTINTQGSADPNAQAGVEADGVNCGAGTDTAVIDNRDGFLDANGNLTPTTGECETVQRPVGPPPPPPITPPGGTSGGGGGQQPSINQPTINPIQQGQQVPSFVPPAPSGVRCSLIFPGTAGPDRFLGSSGGDRMVGLAGNDLMDGLAGNDCLYGGDGNDTMRGGDGNDRLSAGAGNDTADGAAGSDSVYGSAGRDYLLGRDGNDLLSAGDGNDRVSGGAGRDRILAGKGRDTVTAGDGNDVIDVRDGSRDVVNCGAGRDTVRRDSKDVLRSCERRVNRLPRAG
jgi:Ca2+-binding RTX toxin-like protein